MKVKDVERMRFMHCFDCNRIMWRMPLPKPRDNLIQHKCVEDRVVTRCFGRKTTSCQNTHEKTEKNPKGGCVIIISKTEYLSDKENNDGRYAA